MLPRLNASTDPNFGRRRQLPPAIFFRRGTYWKPTVRKETLRPKLKKRWPSREALAKAGCHEALSLEQQGVSLKTPIAAFNRRRNGDRRTPRGRLEGSYWDES